MIGVQDLRSGTVFEEQGNLYQVLSYEHIKMGRGSATIKVKVRNIRSGATTERGFMNNAKVNDVQVLKKELQFLYPDEDMAHFMDPRSYEQIDIPLTKLTDHEYLKEGETFSIAFLNDEPLYLTLPPKMTFKITETGPSIRGNSATNIYKDAVLENGLRTKVPLFMDVGDSIRVDTRTGAYSEKVS